MVRPPRLPSISYKGPGTYFVTTCTNQRRRIFVSQDIVDLVLRHFLQSAERANVEVIAYCFMPDHMHLLVSSAVTGNFDHFMRRAKQMSGFSFAQLTGCRLWQAGYHERVLRSDEAALTAIAYMAANPIRRGLASRAEEWPFWGSARYSREEVLDAIASRLDRNWRG